MHQFKKQPDLSNLNKNIDTPSEIIDGRQAKELVIGFCGAIGCGIQDVREIIKATFEAPYNYECQTIKLSNIIKTVFELLPFEHEHGRYKLLQDKGNELRSDRTTFLIELAIAKIRSMKGIKDGKPTFPNSRRVFLIDQLKHPDEVSLLKKIYGNSFYLFGVLSPTEERVGRLTHLNKMTDEEARELIRRDEKEDVPHGQRVRDTIQHSDFFVRHSPHRNHECQEALMRFVHLMLGEPIQTPTIDEYGMYAAYTASLGSSCLSRQVGAAIIDQSRNLISTGCNDVPKFKGGLYGRGRDLNPGERCFEKEEKSCFNDLHKKRLYEEVGKHVAKELGLQNKQADIVNCLRNTRIRHLLEFSRSIHAEMEGILAAGRKGKSVVDGILYCTTFPCHNCARHIIASGITKVFYIEPFEKSLALDLHGDAITLDEAKKKYVKFLHFEGVAPSKYSELFIMAGERKKSDGSGEMIHFSHQVAVPVIEKYLDSVADYEMIVVDKLSDERKDMATKVMSPD